MEAIPVLRKDRIRQDGKARLYYQIFLNKKRIKLPTKLLIDPDQWDGTNHLIYGKYPLADDMNKLIKKHLGQINSIDIKYFLSNKTLTADLLRSEWLNPSEHIDFYDWAFKEIEDQKGTVTASTIRLRKNAITKLQEYKKNLVFSEIDVTLLEKYEKYLKVHFHNCMNTIHTNMKILRTFVNRAYQQDIIKVNPFKKYRLKKASPEIECLDENELNTLIKKYKSNQLPENYQKALKYFLFSCLSCGQRISDIKRITWDNIFESKSKSGSDYTLIYQPKKTKNMNAKTLTIPLSNASIRIINTEKKKRSGPVFKTYSDPVTNRYLKNVATLCTIKKKINFKMARHTFATIYLKYNPGDIVGLKNILGHSRIEQTLIYVHTDFYTIKKRMKYLDKFY